MHLAFCLSLVKFVSAQILHSMDAVKCSNNLNGTHFQLEFNECYQSFWMLCIDRLKLNILEARLVIEKHSNMWDDNINLGIAIDMMNWWPNNFFPDYQNGILIFYHSTYIFIEEGAICVRHLGSTKKKLHCRCWWW